MSESRTGQEPAGKDAASPPAEDARPGAYDEDGLPLDRPITLDDVRGSTGSGRAVAAGCTVLVLLTLAAFWVVRAVILG